MSLENVVNIRLMRYIFHSSKCSVYFILRAYFNVDAKSLLQIFDLDLDFLRCRME